MKYEALRSYLRSQRQPRLRLSFAEVARRAEVKLPASAYGHAAWWANDSTSHVQAKAWLDAGYKTENVDIAAQTIEFVRVNCAGVREMQQGDFHHQPDAAVKKHPMAGALKGTFTIAPGWDLTRPSLDDDELAEMEANFDRTADMVAEGLRRKK
jgi:hypothetical protein